MKVSRRNFLQFSATILGPGILDFLRTPTWRWSSLPIVQASTIPAVSAQDAAPKVQFVDVAREAGLTTPNVWGGVDRKSYIVEAKGSGIAFFDYDQDGWLDIYLTNGTRLNTTWPPGQAPTTQLYHNNRDGTFTDVTAKSGLGRTGWQTGVCVGDYDNNGWDDLFCSFWGAQRFVPQQRRWHLHRRHEAGGAFERRSSLGIRLHLARLRPRWIP
jgi:hypothetical protein